MTCIIRNEVIVLIANYFVDFKWNLVIVPLRLYKAVFVIILNSKERRYRLEKVVKSCNSFYETI